MSDPTSNDAPAYLYAGRARVLPMLPSSLVAAIKGTYALPGLRNPRHSFDKDRIYFIETIDRREVIVRLDLRTGAREQFVPPFQFVSTLSPSSFHDKIALNGSLAGETNESIIIYEGKWNETCRFKPPTGTGFWFAAWVPGGKDLVIRSNARNRNRRDLHLVTSSGLWSALYEGAGANWIADITQDGRHYLIINRPARGIAQLLILDRESNRITKLTDSNNDSEVRFAQFSCDSRSVYVASNIESDRHYLGYISLVDCSRPIVPIPILTRAGADLTYIADLHDRSVFAFRWSEAERSTLETARVTGNGVETISSRHFTHIDEVSVCSRFNSILLSSSDAATGPEILATDVALNDVYRVRSTNSSVHSSDITFVEPEFISFFSHDGLPLSGWYYRTAASSGGGRLLISFHGGPEAQESRAYNPLYQCVLATGISIFAPNVRGSTGYGKRFANLDNGELRIDAIGDIRACAEMAIERGYASLGSIGIFGESYGGYMAMAGLAFFPGLFATGISIAGFANFLTFFERTEPWMAAVSKRKYGDPLRDREMLSGLSPYFHLANVRAPLFLIHGERDTNAPYSEAVEVFRVLAERNLDVGLLTFPNEGHWIQSPMNQEKIASYIVRWLLKFL